MVRGDCMECKKCEENMYWSHFQTVQFCQFLTGKFDERLAIPKKFANCLRERMARTVALRGPSGHIWNVGLVRSGEILYLELGWNAFVEEHSLQENDILIFKYNGNSRFNISIFDKGSLCEKEACYFVKKCEHNESGRGGKRRRSLEEIPEDTSESSEEVAAYQNAGKLGSDAARTPPSRIPLTRSTPKGRRQTRRGKRRSSGGNSLQLKSRRREVTEEEKLRALHLANAAASKNSFVVVMRATHVYKGFFMSVPADWAKAHLPNKDVNVVLQVKDKTWLAKFQYKGYGGGLTGGWKIFVLENFLEEFDVCVFDIVSGTQDPLMLDVKIFRVVEEVIPPSRTGGATVRRMAKSLRDSSVEAEEEEDDDEDEEENA